MIKLANLLRLNESTRMIKFIHSGVSEPPIDLEDYTKQFGSNTAVHKTVAQHYKGVSPKDLLVFIAKDTTHADKIKNAMQQNGVIGIWADPTTLVLNGND